MKKTTAKAVKGRAKSVCLSAKDMTLREHYAGIIVKELVRHQARALLADPLCGEHVAFTAFVLADFLVMQAEESRAMDGGRL